MSRRRITTFDAREAGGALLVTALSSGFGAVLMTFSAALAAGLSQGDLGSLPAVQLALQIVAWIFLGLAFFVGGIVTVNTFGTIIAGRAKNLALLRLLGSSARDLRKSSAQEGFLVGLAGSLTGLVVGIALAQGALWAGHQWLNFGDNATAPLLSASMIAPTLAAVATTTLSAWIGSKAILRITPIQALGSAQSALESTENGGKRNGITRAVVFAILGIGLMALGIVAGLATPAGVLIAFPGGVLSFIAFMMAATRLVPPLLQIGSSLGNSGAARLAARNTARNPGRATRSTMGIIIGVGLIVMFTVVGITYQSMMTGLIDGEEIGQELAIPALIVLLLVGFSALLAAVGLVNSLQLSAIQRRREVSLLRALGLTTTQVKRMTLLESTRMTVVAILLGTGFGVFYGWVACVSMFGNFMAKVGNFAPSVPWQLLVGVLVGAFLLTGVATLAATRTTISVRPTEALAEA